MSTTAELDPIRPIDRARAAQIVCGQVTRDDEMISAAVQDTPTGQTLWRSWQDMPTPLRLDPMVL